MPLIYCKTELKRKWTKYCILSAAGADNVNGNFDDNANVNIMVFTIKDTKWYVPVVILSVRDNQKLLNVLSKGFERSVYWKRYKTKSIDWNLTVYFDSFRIGYILQGVLKKSVINHNIIRIQDNDSIMCRFYCITFIEYMLAGKCLQDYTTLFSPNDYKKNNKIINRYFKDKYARRSKPGV